ncbi:hypothetical protein [Nocardia transvalensis]|uniref:hypothetical protein n=1 Tax=Nocardia transvalensis TaxID=37333 RepID=UPI0018941E21|nr:hypothetical protein [Nocardia transvalensis]MBF6330930.1 hypothetical protein [Nocardia transvalensis]
MRRTARLMLVLSGVAAVAGLGIGVAAADEYPDDIPWESTVSVELCVQGGGVVDGGICVGGSYQGFIVVG